MLKSKEKEDKTNVYEVFPIIFEKQKVTNFIFRKCSGEQIQVHLNN